MNKCFVLVVMFVFASCSSKVIVKKDSCKPIFDGALLECEEVKK